MAAEVITVVDIEAIERGREGAADAARFLSADTVGAERVEGFAYTLDPGGALSAFEEPARYQLFYVTRGNPVALFQGDRHQLAPGRGVYCDPGEPCAIENPAGVPAAFYRFVV